MGAFCRIQFFRNGPHLSESSFTPFACVKNELGFLQGEAEVGVQPVYSDQFHRAEVRHPAAHTETATGRGPRTQRPKVTEALGPPTHPCNQADSPLGRIEGVSPASTTEDFAGQGNSSGLQNLIWTLHPISRVPWDKQKPPVLQVPHPQTGLWGPSHRGVVEGH